MEKTVRLYAMLWNDPSGLAKFVYIGRTSSKSVIIALKNRLRSGRCSDAKWLIPRGFSCDPATAFELGISGAEDVMRVARDYIRANCIAASTIANVTLEESLDWILRLLYSNFPGLRPFLFKKGVNLRLSGLYPILPEQDWKMASPFKKNI